eukprot:gene20686-biopygen17073
MTTEPSSPNFIPSPSHELRDVSTTAPVAAYNLKLPPFRPHDPTIWFAQVEAQFRTKNITTQRQRFAHVVSVLQPEIAEEVREILLSPPILNPYDTLRNELIKRTSLSEQKRLHQLLNAEELGDRKPSQLLRKMQQLLGEQRLDQKIFRQLFLQRLPINVPLILASTTDEMALDQLASLADKILEVNPAISTISTISPNPKPSPTASADSPSLLQLQINQLSKQVEALTTQINSESKFRRPNYSQRSRSPFRSNFSRQRFRSPSRPDFMPQPICWYHKRFGPQAHRCTPPCSYVADVTPTAPPQPAHSAQQQGNGQARA